MMLADDACLGWIMPNSMPGRSMSNRTERLLLFFFLLRDGTIRNLRPRMTS